jgi:hypothetical protein
LVSFGHIKTNFSFGQKFAKKPHDLKFWQKIIFFKTKSPNITLIFWGESIVTSLYANYTFNDHIPNFHQLHQYVSREAHE